MIENVAHVHGTLSAGNIIFGIDASGNIRGDAHIFTKAHRKMLLGNSPSVLPRSVNRIKFYGHSLGEADYSYFHSIFDHYNLYGDDLDLLNYRTGDKPVELYFYFTDYNGSDETTLRRNTVNSVF